jgi:acylglycerol lipase
MSVPNYPKYSPTRQHIRGYILESPFVAFHPSSKPSKLKVTMGKFAARILPHHQLLSPLDASLLCRDPDVCKRWAEDPLCHDTGTLEGLNGLLERADLLASGGVNITDAEGSGDGGLCRVLWAHGTGDKVCDFAASKALAESLTVKDKTFKWYEGWYHKCKLLCHLRSGPFRLYDCFWHFLSLMLLEISSTF